jgi:hypothetical protein
MGDHWLGLFLDQPGIGTVRDLRKALASTTMHNLADAAEASGRPSKPP